MNENYHNQIIDLFCKNIDYFKNNFDFPIKEIYTKIYFHPYTEIDIVIEGLEGERALLEVKSNSGLMSKFTGKQFQNYRKYDPNASVYLLMGTKDQSIDINDFKLIQFYPLN